MQRLLSAASRRSGCCSRTDLLEHGLTSSAIENYTRAGILERLREGVYVVPWLVDDRTPFFGALASLASGAISVQSAGRRYRLPVPADDRGLGVEITVPFGVGGRSIPGVTVHRTRLPLEIDVVEIDGLRTTSLARTVFDLASSVGPTRLRHILQSAMIHGGLEEAEFRACYQALARRGVRGLTNLRLAMDELFRGEPVPQSVLEARVEEMLRQAGITSLCRQFRPPWFDGMRGTVDFADPVAGVVVEVDGRSWHSTSQAMAEDRRRDRLAAGHGWVVLRVAGDEVFLRPSSVIAEIRAVLVSRTSNRAA